jgi:hypothetical protein
MGTGGSSGGSGGALGGGPGQSGGTGGTVACLPGWRGSPCDVCSSSPPSSGRACGELLDCYTKRPATACDYAEPTQDLQVELAHSVAECRCGAVP